MPPDAYREVQVRSRLLLKLFQLLYGPLAFLHEPLGRLLFGPAWHARRLALFDAQPLPSHYLDLGCGEGRLLAVRPAQPAVGLDSSLEASRRAKRRGAIVVVGDASALPFRSKAFEMVVCTYPGPWILEPRVWDEIARVLIDEGRFAVLLGGDYSRGPWSRTRRIWSQIAYGRRVTEPATDMQSQLGFDGMIGSIHTRPDEWGQFYTWEGTKR